MRRIFLYGAIFTCVLLGLFLFSIYSVPEGNQIQPISSVEIGGQIIHVEVVDTPETRSLGLSGRPALAKDEGMLFIFERDGTYAFWMKDMLFPLDIVWLREDGVVIDIEPSVSPDTYPASFTPDTPARYVLEVSAGFTKEYKVQKGDRVFLR